MLSGVGTGRRLLAKAVGSWTTKRK